MGKRRSSSPANKPSPPTELPLVDWAHELFVSTDSLEPSRKQIPSPIRGKKRPLLQRAVDVGRSMIPLSKLFGKSRPTGADTSAVDSSKRRRLSEPTTAAASVAPALPVTRSPKVSNKKRRPSPGVVEPTRVPSLAAAAPCSAEAPSATPSAAAPSAAVLSTAAPSAAVAPSAAAPAMAHKALVSRLLEQHAKTADSPLISNDLAVLPSRLRLNRMRHGHGQTAKAVGPIVLPAAPHSTALARSSGDVPSARPPKQNVIVKRAPVAVSAPSTAPPSAAMLAEAPSSAPLARAADMDRCDSGRSSTASTSSGGEEAEVAVQHGARSQASSHPADDARAIKAKAKEARPRGASSKEARSALPGASAASGSSSASAPLRVAHGSSSTAKAGAAVRCDRCDGPHASSACPHFKKERDRHPDAQPGRALRGLGSSSAPPLFVRVGRVHRQPPDGSCLFHSLSFGLAQCSASDVPRGARALRENLARWIGAHSELRLADTPLSSWVRWDSGLSASNYAAKMARSGWGGGIEIAACSHAYKVNVWVYEKRGRRGFERISTFDAPPLAARAISPHLAPKSPREIALLYEPRPTVHLLYQGGCHYDALTPDASEISAYLRSHPPSRTPHRAASAKLGSKSGRDGHQVEHRAPPHSSPRHGGASPRSHESDGPPTPQQRGSGAHRMAPARWPQPRGASPSAPSPKHAPNHFGARGQTGGQAGARGWWARGVGKRSSRGGRGKGGSPGGQSWGGKGGSPWRRNRG